MKGKILSSIAGLAMVAGGLTGFGTGVAAAGGGVPLPPPAPLELFTPPNCEYVQDKNGNTNLDCDLPPECEYVTLNGGGKFQVTYIECDIDPACELQQGTFLGTVYWFIDCDEPACDGGCNPIVPMDPVFKVEVKPAVVDNGR